MNVIITGANRGIGLSFAKHYAKLNCNSLILACRNPEKATLKTLKGVTKILPLDLASDESIDEFVNMCGDQACDLLINNAGILHRDTLDTFVTASLEEQFRVNASGPMYLTQKLLPNIRKSKVDKPRIVFITSRVGSMEDNSSGNIYGYRASKAALNSLGKSLSVNLKEANEKIIVTLLHPGYIKTEMVGGGGEMEPDEAVEKMCITIEKQTLEDSGKFVHRDGQILPW